MNITGYGNVMKTFGGITRNQEMFVADLRMYFDLYKVKEAMHLIDNYCAYETGIVTSDEDVKMSLGTKFNKHS